METISIIKASLVVLTALLLVGGGVWVVKTRTPSAKKKHKAGHGGGHGGGHGPDPADVFFKIFIGSFLLILIWSAWLQWSS